MELPVFSIIYIATFIGILYTTKNIQKIYLFNFMILLLLEIYYTQGFFIKLNTVEVSIVTVHLVIMSCLALLYLLKKREIFRRKLIIKILLLLVLPLITLFVEILHPYGGLVMPVIDGVNWDSYALGRSFLSRYDLSEAEMVRFVVQYIKLLCYAVILYVTKSILNTKNIIICINFIVRISYFLVGYGYFEYLLKNMLSIPEIAFCITELLFGVGNSTFGWENTTMLSDSSWRLQGMSQEPAHYVWGLMICCIFLLLYKKSGLECCNKKTNSIVLVLAIILMPMTGGMSSVVALGTVFLVFCVLFIKNYKLLIKTLFGIFALTSIFVGYFFTEESVFLERLDSVFYAAKVLYSNPNLLLVGMDGSAVARFTSIFTSISIWLDNFLFGLSISAVPAHDITATLLVKYGTCGVVIWYMSITETDNRNVSCSHVIMILVLFIAGFWGGVLFGFHSQFYFVFLFEASVLCNDQRTKLIANKYFHDEL